MLAVTDAIVSNTWWKSRACLKAEWNAANHLYHHRGESDPYDGGTIDALDGAPEPGEESLELRFRAGSPQVGLRPHADGGFH